MKVSQLGFGLMRLPLLDKKDFKSVDEPLATRMVHHAIDNGINYFDTAYGYHAGMSELFLGKVLKHGQRNKIYLATKLPVWLIKKKADLNKYLDEQLVRLQTEVIDMYLLHGLNKTFWRKLKEFDVLKFLDAAVKNGKIIYPGFSFHDDATIFKEIVDAYPWIFCLIHLNYVDDKYQAGLEGLEYAHRKGLAVVIMEPLRGGKLVNKVPASVLRIIKQSKLKQTPADFAFRFLYNRPEVSCVLSGISNMEQLVQNIKFASIDHVNTLTPDEIALYSKARSFYKSKVKVGCTSCEYCSPCPQAIPISFIFELYNDVYMYDMQGESKGAYNAFIRSDHQADKCNECGQCEEKCPHRVEIIKVLKEAHELLKQENTS